MNRFVLDCSVTMAWCFEDEADSYADAILDRFAEASAWVPCLWPLEVANVLVVAERRGRLAETDWRRFLDLLSGLPIVVADAPPLTRTSALVALARDHDLSAYDAAYLDLAAREGIPLASRDGALVGAANRLGVPLLNAV